MASSANEMPDSDFRDSQGFVRWFPFVVPVSAAVFAFLVYLIGWAVL